MNPPVEAPASRQRRPDTSSPSGANAASAPASLWPPRETYSGRPGAPGRHHDQRASVVTAVAALVAVAPATRHPTVGDQLGGMVAGPREPPAYQLGVEPETTRGTDYAGSPDRRRGRDAAPGERARTRRGARRAARRRARRRARGPRPPPASRSRRAPATKGRAPRLVVRDDVVGAGGGACSVMAAGYPAAAPGPEGTGPPRRPGRRRRRGAPRPPRPPPPTSPSGRPSPSSEQPAAVHRRGPPAGLPPAVVLAGAAQPGPRQSRQVLPDPRRALLRPGGHQLGAGR